MRARFHAVFSREKSQKDILLCGWEKGEKGRKMRKIVLKCGGIYGTMKLTIRKGSRMDKALLHIKER